MRPLDITRSKGPTQRAVLGAAAVAALLLAQQYGTIPGETLLAATLQNALHIPWFACVVLVIWLVLGRQRPVWMLAAGAAVAIASEVLQGIGQRDVSLYDLGLDLAGAAMAMVGIHLHRRAGPRTRERIRAWSATALLLALTTLAAPAYVGLSYQQRDAMFPRLLAIGSWLQKPLVGANSPSRIVPAPRAWRSYAGKPVLLVRWADNRYPGIELREVVADWTCCDALVLDLYVKGNEPMRVTAAVGHAGTEGTARYSPHILPPGSNRLAIPLRRLGAVGPDANAITRLIVHTSRDYAGRTLLIGDIRLE